MDGIYQIQARSNASDSHANFPVGFSAEEPQAELSVFQEKPEIPPKAKLSDFQGNHEIQLLPSRSTPEIHPGKFNLPTRTRVSLAAFSHVQKTKLHRLPSFHTIMWMLWVRSAHPRQPPCRTSCPFRHRALRKIQVGIPTCSMRAFGHLRALHRFAASSILCAAITGPVHQNFGQLRHSGGCPPRQSIALRTHCCHSSYCYLTHRYLHPLHRAHTQHRARQCCQARHPPRREGMPHHREHQHDPELPSINSSGASCARSGLSGNSCGERAAHATAWAQGYSSSLARIPRRFGFQNESLHAKVQKWRSRTTNLTWSLA